MKRRNDYDTISAFALMAFAISSLCAWSTHVIRTIIDENYFFLAVGAFMAPVGVVHGVLVWIGAV